MPEVLRAGSEGCFANDFFPLTVTKYSLFIQKKLPNTWWKCVYSCVREVWMNWQ